MLQRKNSLFIEGKIQELKTKLALADVIDPSKITQNKTAFGAKVKVMDLSTDEEKTFMLVGPDEADAKNGKISISSPVGKVLCSTRKSAMSLRLRHLQRPWSMRY